MVSKSYPYTNNLRAARMGSGLTQRKVADLLGLRCESRLSQWESGSSVPSIFNLLLLSRIYRIPCEELYRIDLPGRSISGRE